MTLTREQIAEAAQYISRRGFSSPDVQLEIIDHLACKIEEVWQQEPTLTFAQALAKAHGAFGIHGFAPIAASIEKGITKRYSRLFWNQYKQFFATYRIALPLCAFLVGYVSTSLVASVSFAAFLSALVMCVCLVHYIDGYYRAPKGFRKMKTYGLANSAFLSVNLAFQAWNFQLHFVDNSHWYEWYAALTGLVMALGTVSIPVITFVRKTSLEECQRLNNLYQQVVVPVR